MQTVIPFETHAYVRKLLAAGVPEPQAEAHASALAEMLGQLATKQDLELLRQEVRGDLHAMRTEMQELELRIAERLRSQMLWFFAVQFALFGTAVAVIKLSP